ncbi:hypothetical protein [Herbaspirillum sp.]|uniref:hypothetical protein n=1 Tax=Herbaspirillum sp. TaxID=1890675 RepID=UPI001B145005|nr:hypothetical protein [Herbaspirillum sp.]MBO9538569.1 hypothetical protein [Herbaspirillum sp.]
MMTGDVDPRSVHGAAMLFACNRYATKNGMDRRQARHNSAPNRIISPPHKLNQDRDSLLSTPPGFFKKNLEIALVRHSLDRHKKSGAYAPLLPLAQHLPAYAAIAMPRERPELR